MLEISVVLKPICRQRVMFFLLAVVLVVQACNDSHSGSSDSDGSGSSDGTASIEPVVANIRTTVPLAYVASVAMAEVRGIDVPNADSNVPCHLFGYPCAANVSVTLSPDDLPIGLDEYGDISVAGLWVSANEAVLTMSFNGFQIGSPNNIALSISTVPVVQNGNELLISYGSIDINVGSAPEDPAMLSATEVASELGRVHTIVSDDPEVNVDMDAWVISVATQGTDDFSDDDYSISGGGQYIGVDSGNTSVIQLGLVNMQISADCALNPVAGMSVLNELDVSQTGFPKIGTAIFRFQPDCDGTARILTAIGTYGIYINDDISLGL